MAKRRRLGDVQIPVYPGSRKHMRDCPFGVALSSSANEAPGTTQTFATFNGAKSSAQRAMKAGRNAVVFLDCPDTQDVLLTCLAGDQACMSDFDTIGRDMCPDCVSTKDRAPKASIFAGFVEELPLGTKLAAVGAVAWAYLAWRKKKDQDEINAIGAKPAATPAAG